MNYSVKQIQAEMFSINNQLNSKKEAVAKNSEMMMESLTAMLNPDIYVDQLEKLNRWTADSQRINNELITDCIKLQCQLDILHEIFTVVNK